MESVRVTVHRKIIRLGLRVWGALDLFFLRWPYVPPEAKIAFPTARGGNFAYIFVF
jgi:hypothetical protein